LRFTPFLVTHLLQQSLVESLVLSYIFGIAWASVSYFIGTSFRVSYIKTRAPLVALGGWRTLANDDGKYRSRKVIKPTPAWKDHSILFLIL